MYIPGGDLIIIPFCDILVTDNFLVENLLEEELGIDFLVIHPEEKKIILGVVVYLVLEIDLELYLKFFKHVNIIEILKEIPINHTTIKERLI
jgi:hypothetical protein